MLEENTYGAILDRMLARVPQTLDRREGSIVFDANAPAAMELARLYVELARIRDESYGDTAAREALVLRCHERGISPYPATCASLRCEVTPPEADIAGRRFRLGDYNYAAREALAPGVWRVECETPGAAGGRQCGRLVPVEYIAGLERAEAVGLLIPGEDEEDTEALRARYFSSFAERAFGGNRRDYIERTNALPGVGSCKVTRAWNGGIRPAALLPDGAVRAWVADVLPTLDAPCAAWLRAVHEAAASGQLSAGGAVRVTILDASYRPADRVLVEAVQQALDPPAYAGEGYGLAPIGHVVTVESAVGAPVEVTANLTFETGCGWDTLQSALEEAVESYLTGLCALWADSERLTVRLSQIETRLLAVPGVVDIEGTALNGRQANLVLDALAAPVLGGVHA